MSDNIHVEFTDVLIEFKGAGIPYYYSTPEDMNMYYKWMRDNLKKNTYLVYPISGMAQLLSEDLVMFKLRFGDVFRIVPVNNLNAMPKIEKLLINETIREKYDTSN